MGVIKGHRIALLEAYFQLNFHERCVEKRKYKYLNIFVLYQLVCLFHGTGPVEDRQRNGKPKVVKLEFVSEVQQ